MPFAIKINGNLWMSFADGDYRDYMNKCINPHCKCKDCNCDLCHCSEENPCGCEERRLAELRGGQTIPFS